MSFRIPSVLVSRASFRIALFAVVVIAIILRLAGSFQPVSFDESIHLIAAQDYRWDTATANLHPPVLPIIFHVVDALSGGLTVAFRLVTIAFFAGTLWLTYAIIRRRDPDPNRRWWFIFLAALSSYALFASLIIDNDGPFVTFFITLMFYFVIRYEDQPRKLFIVGAGIALALGMLSKYTAAMGPVILFLYLVARRPVRLSSMRLWASIAVIGAALFALFPILLPVQFHATINKPFAFVTFSNPALFAIQMAQVAIWLTPMLIIPVVLLLVDRGRWGANRLFLSWVGVVVLFYLIVNGSYGSPIQALDRYYMIMIPALLAIASAVCAKMLDFKKYALPVLGATLIIAIVFTGLAMLPHRTLNFEPKVAFLGAIAQPNTYAYMQGVTGPVGFYLSLLPVLAAFLISAAALVLMVLNRWRMRMFLVFLVVALAFNVHLSSEYIFAVSAPSIPDLTGKVIAFANTPQAEPLYVFRNPGYEFYFRHDYEDIRVLDFFHEFDAARVAEVTRSNGTVLLIDFPQVNKESILWKSITGQCRQIQNWSSKGRTLGFAFVCDGSRSG